MHNLTSRQLCAFCFCALSAPAITACAGLPWQWVLSASLLSALFGMGMAFLRRRSGTLSIPAILVSRGGAGRALIFCAAVFFALLLRSMAENVCDAFPDAPRTPFVPLTMLAVCAWACARSRTAAIRAVCVAFFFLCAAYLVITVFALPDLEPARLSVPPQGGDASLLSVLLLPLAGIYLIRAEDRKSMPTVWWLPLFAAFAPAASALVCAVPGAAHSYYTMAKSIELLSVAQRVEPLVSVALTIGWFAAMCLAALTVGELGAALGGERRKLSVCACAFAATAVFGPIPVTPWFYAVGITVFCAILPLAAQAMVSVKEHRKKVEKNQKNA